MPGIQAVCQFGSFSVECENVQVNRAPTVTLESMDVTKSYERREGEDHLTLTEVNVDCVYSIKTNEESINHD